MNLLFIIVLALTLTGLVAIALARRWLRQEARDHTLCLANVGEGTHERCIGKLADAVVATRYLLAKRGTDVDHFDICGASDQPLGVITDEVAAIEDLANIELLGTTPRTLLMVASETMTFDDDVYAAANGTVQDKPTAAGTYWKVGKCITAGVSTGLVEVQTCFPTKVIIDTVAALTSAAITGTLTGTVNGAMVDIAADTPACAGGATPSATNVDTAINTAVATIVSGTNEQLKELLTALNEAQADLVALRANIVALQANGAVAV